MRFDPQLCSWTVTEQKPEELKMKGDGIPLRIMAAIRNNGGSATRIELYRMLSDDIPKEALKLAIYRLTGRGTITNSNNTFTINNDDTNDTHVTIVTSDTHDTGSKMITETVPGIINNTGYHQGIIGIDTTQSSLNTSLESDGITGIIGYTDSTKTLPPASLLPPEPLTPKKKKKTNTSATQSDAGTRGIGERASVPKVSAPSASKSRLQPRTKDAPPYNAGMTPQPGMLAYMDRKPQRAKTGIIKAIDGSTVTFQPAREGRCLHPPPISFDIRCLLPVDEVKSNKSRGERA
jgi:hypothetical protein